jgi:hypothetical protein
MPASSARTLRRTLGLAAVTAGASLAFLWPGSIRAESERDIVGTFVAPGDTALGEVRAHGEVVHDPKAKSGWGVEVTFENPTGATQNVRVVVGLQRWFFNPDSRTSSAPNELWRRGDSVALAPNERITRVFALPLSLAADLDASNVLAHGKARAREAAAARGEPAPSWTGGIEGSPRRNFTVTFHE